MTNCVRSDSFGDGDFDLSPSVLSGKPSADFFLSIKKAAPPPHRYKWWRTVCDGAYICLQTALDFVPGTSQEACQVLEAAKALKADAAFPEGTNFSESSPATTKLKTHFPQWDALFKAAHSNDQFYCCALGLLLLQSFQTGLPMPAKPLKALKARETSAYSLDDLRKIVEAPSDTFTKEMAWVKRLNTIWPGIKQIYGAVPTEAGNESKLYEVLSKGFKHASLKHRGEIHDHTRLSAEEVLELGPVLERMLLSDGRDSEEAAIAMLSWQSPLTLKRLADVALIDIDNSSTSIGLDIDKGIWRIDLLEFNFLKGQADVIVDGHVPSTMVVCKPLPQSLHRYLKRRYEPSMTCVGNLLPKAELIDSEANIFRGSSREIKPSYARWVRSAGAFYCGLGIDNLVAALLSGDLTMAATSKLYYTVVWPEELWCASAQANKRMGWSPPVAMPNSLLAVGARVVPTDQRVKEVFEWTEHWVNEARPNNRSDAKKLFEFHNRYAVCVAWRVGFLTAARRTSEFAWTAKQLDPSLSSLVLQDKKTSSFSGDGGLPVPLAAAAKEQICLYLKHLQAMDVRLRRYGYEKAHSWVRKAIALQDVPMFCAISNQGRTECIGTSDFMNVLDPKLEVAPDCGRKFWETKLRQQHLATAKIDAFLRHEIQGQERFISTGDFQVSAALDAISGHIDLCCQQMQLRPLKGLRSHLAGASNE